MTVVALWIIKAKFSFVYRINFGYVQVNCGIEGKYDCHPLVKPTTNLYIAQTFVYFECFVVNIFLERYGLIPI